ncbi:hypothetical protein [Deinococcus sp. 6GRE01]|uniref:hypothetical protein n=1 Tax=Deinococcus sp. 6GRE01 TaxID=2745873 RepID=UPI001E3D46F5|nr:hypothetical protein [Deinococcus sp. 6GRE01]MCD0157181.1 hypothetical protein [Deinococcus sp. 6GRE01]
MKKSLCLALLLLSPASATKLELPTFLRTVKDIRSGKLSSPQQPYWFNPMVLLPTEAPALQDNANAYARWGERRSTFSELAIWRTTNGKAIIGVNTAFPPRAACGDYPCGPTAAFIAWNGTQYVAPPEDTELIAGSCANALATDLPLSTADKRLYAAAQARLRTYRPYLRDPNSTPRSMCIFPQHGTTITVAVLNTDVVFAHQDTILPLYYYTFDKVKGTFTATPKP